MSPHDDFENRRRNGERVSKLTDGGRFSNIPPRLDAVPVARHPPAKAGVPVDQTAPPLPEGAGGQRLDAGADVTIEEPVPGRYVIEDDGRGFLDKTGKKPATPQEIAELFSIDRPLMSSKQFRKPQRGALGNGLRVVGGVGDRFRRQAGRHHARQRA